MKKYIALVLALACVLGLAGCAGRSYGTTSSEYKSFKFENVSKLIIISIDGKRYEVTAPDTVRQITENIESIQFEKGESSENSNGFGPFIQWYDANDNLIESISVMAEETIIYNRFFWTAADGNIDYTALNQILGNVNQDIERIGTDTDEPSSLDGVTMEEAEYSDAGVSMISQKDLSVASVWDREVTVSLSAEDAAVIDDLLASGNWMEGTGDCLDDCIIFMDSEEILYDSNCGTFNDTGNEKSLHLTEEQQAEVNAILEKYIALGMDGIKE